MLDCNYICSDNSLCYYVSATDSLQCYFHDKVRRGLITGYYGRSESNSTELAEWVNLR